MDASRWTRDPRLFQIAVLGSLLAWGAFGLDLEIRPGIAAVILASALAVQWLGGRAAGLPASSRGAFSSRPSR